MTSRLALLTLFFLATLGMFLGIAGLAYADSPTLEQRIALVVPTLASKRDEPVDASELAAAVASVPHVNRDWAALILTIGTHESHFAARISRSEYRGKEGDSGAAWGCYQAHKSTLNMASFGSPDIRVQTLEASRALRSAFYMCGVTNHQPRADWVARTISCYAGRKPDAQWAGLQQRLATFANIRGRL